MSACAESFADALALSVRPSRRLRWALAGLLLLAVLLTGCERNRPRATAPTASVPPIAVPPTGQAGQQPAPPVETTPPPSTKADTGITPPPAKPAEPSRTTRSGARRNTPPKPAQPAPPPAAAAAPAQPAPKAQAGEMQMQIGAQVPAATVQSTEQLLQTAENNLRRVTRQLNDGEQAMLRQVRNYITQSRTASRDGDLERAYNLAMKANLLSGELAK